MACKGFWECLLRLLNFLMVLVGLAMVGFGIYPLVKYERAEDSKICSDSTRSSHANVRVSIKQYI